MRFMGMLSLVAAVICAIHAGKRGRYNWIYIILIFPAVGCAIYFFMHMLPEIRRSKTMEDAGDQIIKKIAPTRKIEKLKTELEFSDTIENRLLLAREYMEIGAYEEAIKLNESCLEGIFENEPDIIYDLARAYFMVEKYQKAKEWLLQIKENHPEYRHKEALLLLAMTYEKLRETDAAIDEYEYLIEAYPGEEARCRFAMLLKQNGRTDEAKKIFNQILFNVGHSPRYYKKNQRKWIRIARQNLNEA